MPVKINSSGGGSVTLSSGGIATDVTATFPATTGNAVVDTAVQTLTNKTLVGAVMTSMASSVLTLGTAQASTSGTAIDFTGIPSWARRVTVMFNGISTNGTSNLQIQIGSGSFTVTGYSSAAHQFSNSNASSTTGFIFTAGNSAAALTFGTMVISTLGSNVWTEMFGAAVASNSSCSGGGAVALSGALDRVRITTVNGTDVFDAGTINIVWE